MLGRIAGRASRYLQTYLRLIGDFAQTRGRRFAAMVVLVSMSAFLYPLPFVALVGIVNSAERGGGEARVRLLTTSIEMPFGGALAALLGFAVAVLLLNFLAGRFVTSETTRWQNEMQLRLLARLPRIARLDRVLDLGVPATSRGIVKPFQTALRSGYLIGRLIDNGIRHLVLVVGSTAFMIWLDGFDMLVVTATTLVFLPAYGLIIASVARARGRYNAQVRPLMATVRDVMTGRLGMSSAATLDMASLSEQARDILSQPHRLANEQMARLVGVTLVAGLHFFACVYAVILAEGNELGALSAKKLMFLVVLIVMLRSVLGLAELMSRLSRGYPYAALLRTLLYPPARPDARKPNSEETAPFVLRIAGGKEPKKARTGKEAKVAESAGGHAGKLPIGLGTRLLFLAPETDHAFNLLPLANQLSPTRPLAAGMLDFIPLIDAAGIGPLARGETVPGAAEAMSAGEGRARIELALAPDPLDPAKALAIALTGDAYRRAKGTEAFAAFARERVIIVMAGSEHDPAASADIALAVLSDGERVVAAGAVTEILEGAAKDIRRWSRRRGRQDDADDLDELTDDDF
ncbi:MAG: hypothetical protein R3D33_00585 [Hyphomicrobiaceae bacterium]